MPCDYLFIFILCRFFLFSTIIFQKQSNYLSFLTTPGTSRGQADGFDLEILAKLKDVKSKVNIVCLHQIYF